MNLPKRYNPKTAEPQWQEFWEKNGIFKFDDKSKKPIYSIDTPPPYVSAAHLHVGHAMSYSQAEFIVRYRRMKGDAIYYPMGFDDNGLPTERFVENKYKIDKSKTSRKEFIDLCLQETALGRQTYESLWRSLGLSVDWSQNYSTIDDRCRRTSQLSFIDLYRKGRIYHSEAPTMWCPYCQTALAQADLEDEILSSSLNDIYFYTEDNGPITISTTRPELIPACVGIFVHPEDTRYQHIWNKRIRVPFSDRTVAVYTDSDVKMDFGSGAMMVCTWGDPEDVRRWREFSLETRQIINADGTMNEKAGEFAGLNLTEARKAILKKLAEQNQLRQSKEISHAVQTHERCFTPVEFFQTPQWFIQIMDRKEKYLQMADELNWYPEFMKIRYLDWVKNLKWDWCISRQRYYGVPFPIWYCGECGEAILPDPAQLPVDPTLDSPPCETCPNCGGRNFRGESDVMDTWMTSSLTPQINAEWNGNGTFKKSIFPMSLRVQAFEIIRTWLFYTIVKAEAHSDSLPWQNVMISGWGLDRRGEKMSKRRGNFVTPEKMIEKYSADALRFWAASSTLGNNLKFLEEDVAVGQKLLTKLWNACRFAYRFFPDELLSDKITEPIDQAILARLNNTIQSATDHFEAYEYFKARQAIEEFFWKDFCDNYLELVKARLWGDTENIRPEQRQSALAALQTILRDILKLFSPFIPHLTEELFQAYFAELLGEKSIHLSQWPEPKQPAADENSEALFEQVLQILTQVRHFKSEQKLAATSPIHRVAIQCGALLKPLLEESIIDLKSGTRAEEISIFANADLENFKTGNIICNELK